MSEIMSDLAPICLFVYKRLSETRQTVESLQKNFLAGESGLFIFSDGYKNENDIDKINQVREYIKTISGFKKITLFESPINKGLANSIIAGVTQIIEQYGKVIVLEDDLIATTNFLDFMNQALNYYAQQGKIFSIACFSHKIKYPPDYNYNVFLQGRPTSWGWATWLNRWNTIDWKINNWNTFKKNRKQIRAFNENGRDLFETLKNNIK
jgi:hypothetical protein